MLTERENMEICWNHEQPEWVPMINTASQMIICPEINDRPLFMSGKDDFGLDWEVDPAHPELMSHVSPTAELFDDITEWPDFSGLIPFIPVVIMFTVATYIVGLAIQVKEALQT